MTSELVIVALIVFLAVVILVQKFKRTIQSGGCSGCNCCAKCKDDCLKCRMSDEDERGDATR